MTNLHLSINLLDNQICFFIFRSGRQWLCSWPISWQRWMELPKAVCVGWCSKYFFVHIGHYNLSFGWEKVRRHTCPTTGIERTRPRRLNRWSNQRGGVQPRLCEMWSKCSDSVDLTEMFHQDKHHHWFMEVFTEKKLNRFNFDEIMDILINLCMRIM